jgi:fructose-bisphosphate aldolase class I
METSTLETTAQRLIAPGKGILAADESEGTIARRFDAVKIPNTEDNRRRYRQLFFTTPGIAQFISGVILFDETIRQAADDRTPFVDVLSKQGIVPGIKVDRGSKPLAGAPGEQVTEGLDGLRERLGEYRTLGAHFTKWRAVIVIGEDGRTPTARGLHANAHALARYAALCQEASLVPIVEPEVLMEGAHSIERCAEVTEAALHTVFEALWKERVILEGMLLKPSMVLPGREAVRQASVDEVAQATLRCLRSSASTSTSPPPSPASFSCPAARARSGPPRISMPSTVSPDRSPGR